MQERRLVPLCDVRPEPVCWLWANRIPTRALTLLEGDPGQGKSALLYDLAARLTRGLPMPSCDRALEPAGVVLLQAEDDLAARVRPGLQAAGANLKRVYAYDRKAFGSRPLTLPEDLGLLEVAVADVGARLVVIDPLGAFLGAALGSARAVRQALAPLLAFAERAGLALVLVRHLVKGGSGSAIYRGAGSIDLIAAARSALRVVPDPTAEGEHQHLLTQIKGSLGSAATLAYRTVRKEGAIVVEWDGVRPHTTEDLAGAEAGGHSALREAMHVLYSLLNEGPVPADEATRLAQKAGVSSRTLARAKKLLRVRSRKEGSGKGSRWLWQLPDDQELLRPFRDRDLEDLTHRLLHGGEDPPLPGDEWKAGGDEDDGPDPSAP